MTSPQSHAVLLVQFTLPVRLLRYQITLACKMSVENLHRVNWDVGPHLHKDGVFLTPNFLLNRFRTKPLERSVSKNMSTSTQLLQTTADTAELIPGLERHYEFVP